MFLMYIQHIQPYAAPCSYLTLNMFHVPISLQPNMSTEGWKMGVFAGALT